MSTEVVPFRPPLFEAEQELLVLLDLDSEALSPEEETELQLRIQDQLQYNVEKRERFGLVLLSCDHHVEIAKREIERLRLYVKRLESMSERMRRYGSAAIRALGVDEKGKHRKLVGRTITLFVRALPVSVDVKNEEAIPDRFKRVTVQLPAHVWLKLVDDNPLLAGAAIKAVDISKESIRDAIEAGEEVPGADLRLAGHDYSLVVK